MGRINPSKLNRKGVLSDTHFEGAKNRILFATAYNTRNCSEPNLLEKKFVFQSSKKNCD